LYSSYSNSVMMGTENSTSILKFSPKFIGTSV